MIIPKTSRARFGSPRRNRICPHATLPSLTGKHDRPAIVKIAVLPLANTQLF
jgi:hypothetical protein